MEYDNTFLHSPVNSPVHVFTHVFVHQIATSVVPAAYFQYSLISMGFSHDKSPVQILEKPSKSTLLNPTPPSTSAHHAQSS